MSEELNPCPWCGGKAKLVGEHRPAVVCSNQDCKSFGPVADYCGAKWNALPRRTDAAPGMSDGELRSRVALVTCDRMSAREFGGSCGLDAEWWNENSREVRAELDRRAALRNEYKP